MSRPARPDGRTPSRPTPAVLRRFLARFQWSDVLAGPDAPRLASPADDPPGRPDAREINELSLVLSARGIPNRPRYGSRAALLVRNDRLDQAREELAAYVRENEAHAVPAAPAHIPAFDNGRSALSVLICLAALFSLTGSDLFWEGVRLPWLALGGGDSRAILAGQWWRLATALTLHGDAAHMAGNLVLGGVFMLPLCREIGVGPAYGLTLASGLLGNLLKVLVQGPGQHFIGASTAVFGAVGLLGAILAARAQGRLTLRRLAPAGAALMVLAFLGSGSEEVRNIDLAGHFFGFAAGVGLGLGLSTRLPSPMRPQPRLQAMIGLWAALALPAAWAWAVSSH